MYKEAAAATPLFSEGGRRMIGFAIVVIGAAFLGFLFGFFTAAACYESKDDAEGD